MPEIQKPLRTWREIAEEASHERDQKKLQKLIDELERALDDRAKRLHPQSTPPEKKQSA